MQVTATSLPEVLMIEPTVIGDERGFFLESFNRKLFAEKTGLTVDFVQYNHSRSVKGVLRGLHYQIHHPQGKLVRVVCGSVFDVVVDIRKSSANFGRWVGIELSEENLRQLWVPPGFAHGFLVTSESADFLYMKPTIGIRSTSAAYVGMIRPSQLNGRYTVSRAFPNKMRKGRILPTLRYSCDTHFAFRLQWTSRLGVESLFTTFR